MKLVKANDADLCDFRGDLRSVSEAETVILDSLVAEIQNLKHELVPVLATVRNQADHLEETGQIQKTSLSELREQR